MKKWLKISGLIFLFLLIVLQFFPGKNHEVILENPDDIANHVDLGIAIEGTLRTSCYDCHSYETDYPWYEKVVPVSWWIDNHIEEARENLNFSIWDTYTEKKKHHKIEELIEEVEEENMPLNSYTWIHRDAILSGQERKELIAWAKNYMNHLRPEED